MKTLSYFMATRPFLLRTILSISLIATTLLVSSCGQTGDLYLPDDTQKPAKQSQ